MSITDKEIAMRILFSKRLGDLIEKHGIQQNDLAIRIGVSESTVGKWLLKKAMPRMGTIQKLSDYFSVPKSYFLEESPAAPQEAPAARFGSPQDRAHSGARPCGGRHSHRSH